MHVYFVDFYIDNVYVCMLYVSMYVCMYVCMYDRGIALCMTMNKGSHLAAMPQLGAQSYA